MNQKVRWDWQLRKNVSLTQLKRDFLTWVTLYCMCPGDIIIRTTWPVTKESLFKSGPNMDEIECLSISYRFVARGVTVQVTARNTGTVIIIARVARGVTDQEEERKYHELTTYSWSSLQWSPWGQKKPGGGTPLQEANRDVSLDGVAFSQLEWLLWGHIFNRFTRMGSQIFGFLGWVRIQNGKILG